MAGFVNADGDVRGVDAGCHQFFHHLDALGNRAAQRHSFFTADAEEQGEVRADQFPGPPDDLEWKAQEAVRSAAVLVRAFIGVGRHEFGDKVAVGPVNLGGVAARVFYPACGLCKFFYEVPYLGDGERLRYLLYDGIGRRRGRYGLPVIDKEWEGAAARVVKLDRDPGAIFMYCIGQLRETGYQAVVVQAQLVPAAQSPFPVHGGHLDYDQSEAAPGAGLVVPDQPVRDPAAVRGEAASHGRYR